MKRSNASIKTRRNHIETTLMNVSIWFMNRKTVRECSFETHLRDILSLCRVSSLPFLSVQPSSEKKKTITTHRNFTRNGRRANHRGLLLLNILLFAQGNLGAGKRGSRDREGHSVRFIIRKFVLVSHPQRKEEVKQTEAKIKLKNGLRKVLLSQQERTKKFKKLQINHTQGRFRLYTYQIRG